MSAEFRDDVLSGLANTPKTLPSKYFYDAEGSRLFEAITATAEYYPTRTETQLLESVAPEIAEWMTEGGSLIEFGSGASVKTRLLLDAAPHLARYVPLDISPEALAEAVVMLKGLYPSLLAEPIVGDFTAPFTLTPEVLAAGRLGFFPGSTIGNFGPDEAVRFLERARAGLGEGADFLIGIDLVKDPATLEAAYDDAEGVTAAFNKNLLARINRELDGDFDLAGFDHHARWNAAASRMEMHLVSRVDQPVRVAGRVIPFSRGESIHTENSYKFTVSGFARLAEAAGWTVGPVWTTEPAFALVMLEG